MAITGENSLSLALSGARPPLQLLKAATPTLVAGRPHSLWYLAGSPGAGVASTSGMSGAALTSATGQIPFTNPTGGNFAYLARFWGQTTIAGSLLLCDRLWENSGINVTLTSAQTINSVQFPARDINGSSNGEGVLIGVEVSTATGSGTPTLSMSYTNSDNTSGRTASNIQATAASSAIGAFYMMGLQGSDRGVRSVQTFTLSATWTSGAIHLVAYRVLAEVLVPAAFIPAKSDLFDIMMTRLYDNTVPFLIFIPSTTTATVTVGGLIYTHG